jgi:Immunity protein 26
MKKLKHETKVGDVYAVPLDALNSHYGYVRIYQGASLSILGVVSVKKMLPIEDIKKYPEVRVVMALADMIHKGIWPLIGNWPFPDEESSWPKPMKQEPMKWNPSVRMVIVKGNYLSEQEYGAYDELPTLLKCDDESLIEEIISLNKTQLSNIT